MYRLLLDTANIIKAKNTMDYLNISGITTNPTILSREPGNFWDILKSLRDLILDKELHVQVTADHYDDMLKEADVIVNKLGQDTFIKVPVNTEGLRAIYEMKKQNYKVTATAVYMPQQAILAAFQGADYIAPYYNRIDNINAGGLNVIQQIAEIYKKHSVNTKILAASFRNTQQIMSAIACGADAVTADPRLYNKMVDSALIKDAVREFKVDWINTYGNCSINTITN